MNLKEMRFNLTERSLAGLNRLAGRRGQNTMPAHLAVGIDGEDAALFYLQRKGYTVVARRWSSGEVPGDVDLIAWDGPMLCFIEVKTRTARDLTQPKPPSTTTSATYCAASRVAMCGSFRNRRRRRSALM